MNKQEISTLLEICSFFFVGIDLYGKERMTKMQETFLGFSERIYQHLLSIKNFEWSKHRRSKFMISVYILTGVIEVSYYIIITSKQDFYEFFSEFNFWAIVIIPISAGSMFCLFLLPVLFSIIIILFAAISMVEVVNFILRGMIWAFRFYQIEGVFLFIGTLMFLLSKYWQLY